MRTSWNSTSTTHSTRQEPANLATIVTGKVVLAIQAYFVLNSFKYWINKETHIVGTEIRYKSTPLYICSPSTRLQNDNWKKLLNCSLKSTCCPALDGRAPTFPKYLPQTFLYISYPRWEENWTTSWYYIQSTGFDGLQIWGHISMSGAHVNQWAAPSQWKRRRN